MNNFTELIITSLLAAFDRFMDLITRGAWTRARGDVNSNVSKISGR